MCPNPVTGVLIKRGHVDTGSPSDNEKADWSGAAKQRGKPSTPVNDQKLEETRKGPLEPSEGGQPG